MDRYFNQFFDIQRNAIDIIKVRKPANKYLEDYLTIFSDLDTLSDLSGNFTKENFKNRLQPLITIASNNGFVFMT